MDHFDAGVDPRVRLLLEDARRVVQRAFADFKESLRPFMASHTLLLPERRQLAHLGRSYAMAARTRRGRLLIQPVSALLFNANRCQDLAPDFQAGVADYLAMTALFHSDPAFWPEEWEVYTCGAAAQMAAQLAGRVTGFRGVAARSFLLSGQGEIRGVVNAHLASRAGFAAVHACFSGGMLQPHHRLDGLLRGTISAADWDRTGRRR